MEYGIALFGSLVYNYILFVIAKNKCDKEGVDFLYAKYCKMNWDNWGLTILLAPVLVWYLPDIMSIINTKMSLSLETFDIYYMGTGPFTEIVLFGMFKLIGWKDTWVAPVHK